MTDGRRYPLKLEELKAALEQKARRNGQPRTRRVRTAEGAKKYGVPIGTIIRLDANGKPFKRSVKPTTKPSEDQNVSTVPEAPRSDSGFTPTDYGDARDAKGAVVQVGGEYTINKTGGKWFVDRIGDNGTVHLYQLDRNGNRVGTMRSLSTWLYPVPVIMGKDGKRVEAGDPVVLDGDKSKVWTVDRTTPTGKSMTLRRYDPKKQEWEEIKGVKPTRVTSGEGITEDRPEGTVPDANGNLIQRDDYVEYIGGATSSQMYMVSQVLDDGRILLMREDVDGRQFSAGIASAMTVKKLRGPRAVPAKDMDGFPVKAGPERYTVPSLDPDDPTAQWVITSTSFSAGGRLKMAKLDGDEIVPGSERFNVHPKRLSRVNKPGQSATGKDGKPIELGKRYIVPTADGRHDGVWQAESFKPLASYELNEEPYVISVRVNDDGTLNTNEIKNFRASSMLPEGSDPVNFDIANVPSYQGKAKGSRSQNIMKLSDEHAAQAIEDYKDMRRRGWLKPDSAKALERNKAISFANAPSNVTVTVSLVAERWRVRVEANDTQILRDDASPVWADNPSDALLLASLAMRSWERRAFDKDGSGKKDAFGRRAANRRPRDFDGFNAYDDGIRGLDWKMESDPDVDWTDKVARRRMVDKELAELGTSIKHLSPSTQGYDDFDVEHLENIARTLRTHENQYPGIVRKMFTELRYDTDRNGSGIAYTNTERSYGFKQGQLQTGYMGFNAAWFGNRQAPGQTRESMWAGYRPAQGPERPVGFGVNAPEDLLETEQFDSFTSAGVVDVTTHEMGHNVGYVLFGMMGRNRRHEAQELMDSPDPQARLTNKYREEFFRILDAYGILDSNVSITLEDFLAKNKLEDNPQTRTRFARYQSDLMDDSGIGTKGQKYRAETMNREALAEHLSRYGSTNFQELMAETWTGYQHNPNPGDFVREMGALMEDVLIDFLDDTQAGPEADFLGRSRSEARKRAVAYRNEPWPESIKEPEEAKVYDFFDKLYPKNNIERIIAMLTSPEDSEWENEGGEPLFGAGFFRREDGSINQEARFRYLESFNAFARGVQEPDMYNNPVLMSDEEIEDEMEKKGYTTTERKAYMLARQHARSIAAFLITRKPEGKHRKEGTE